MKTPPRLVANGVPDDADAAHRFRTVLTTAQGYAELLRRRLAEPHPDTALLARTLDRLLAELARLTRLVEEQFGPYAPRDPDATTPPETESDTPR